MSTPRAERSSDDRWALGPGPARCVRPRESGSGPVRRARVVEIRPRDVTLARCAHTTHRPRLLEAISVTSRAPEPRPPSPTKPDARGAKYERKITISRNKNTCAQRPGHRATNVRGRWGVGGAHMVNAASKVTESIRTGGEFPLARFADARNPKPWNGRGTGRRSGPMR